jgi:glutamate N-acetyltransferase/amino-acid N-acetyltransferase
MTASPCPGFQLGAVSAGIKKNGDADLALIYSEAPSAAAAVFTRNRVQAAPVVLDRQRIQDGRAQAVIVNSGNANCCTGPRGMQDARKMAAVTAAELGIDEELVLVSSTGVIGEPLPVEKIEKALPALKMKMHSAGVTDFARAIMTTDTVPKALSRRVASGAGDFTLTGIAKGAGMIRPDLATMLCYLITDIKASSAELKQLLTSACERSFNRISIDGDTSTNDTVLILANGRSGIDIGEPAHLKRFQAALDELTMDLAKWLVKDGEGVTKLVTIVIRGAAGDADALRLAETVAHSNLVKTALFGEDANWGRIIAAAGRAGVPMDPDRVDIYFDTVKMVAGGVGCGPAAEKQAAEVLKRDEYPIIVDIHMGSGSAEMITCDFSIDYVRINADYRT